ncbi:pentatricopeptide repeat-containing protein At1g71420 [Morus notabilis]|uniref:pentatricopeptide repeat-containing protein At1g71420 n=1 Tax=Morus notabilis TaxID=981085 RepID=UPI000CED5ABF|nr:pentatricopeptide repeat-containing protein At1g71420 [Morus notabilis]
MLRLTTRARRVSVRRFSSGNLPTLSRLTPEADNLLDRVRVLATRGRLKEALSLFYAIIEADEKPRPHCHQTYATLFHECARHGRLREGLCLHRHMVAHNPMNRPDTFVTNHLINMYCKFGHLDYAHQLFDEMPHRNLVSWTALISGYAQREHSSECFRLFSAMLAECRPNEFAFASVLSSCREGEGRFGRQVHALALKMCLDACLYVANTLIMMYNKCHGGNEAWSVFNSMEYRNTVTWNSMIAAFQFHGLGARGIDLFIQMHHMGISFDRATLLSVFTSFCESADKEMKACFRFCLQLHCLTVKTGFLSEVKVATALMKAYSDLGGNAVDCYRVFLETSCHRDIVSWTSIMTIFAERDPERALLLFSQLCQEGLAPDWYTFSIVLKACAGLVTERHAAAVHSRVIKSGFEGDTVLTNSLIHAYARCASISMSKKVFDEIEERDVVSWNSMLKAYALHGRAREALHLFSEMNLEPDSATLVALLCACSHAGLVEDGIKIFDCMRENYGIVPQIDHYACMVDMYGRAGKIHEAEKLIGQMPMEPDSVVWSALLGSCKKHGETGLAKLASDKLKELEPRSSLGYVQMSNIYYSSGKFNEAGTIWDEMKECRVRKEPGLSWIEIGNRVHEFASGGCRHPDREVICSKLDGLIRQLKEMGYVPETSLSLHDIEEEQKEENLYRHSEKLALMYFIMNEGSLHPCGSVIKIIKNISICVDCHNFMKLASDLLQKEIVVRDSNRFHHFNDGICSCNDYW